MPSETMLSTAYARETAFLLAHRLDRALVAAPFLRARADEVRREVHLRRFRRRLREAQERRADPFMDVARVVMVPTSLVSRHTQIAGDHYPILHPGAVIAGDWDLAAWTIADRPYYAQMRQALQGERPWEGTEIHGRFVGRALGERRAWRRHERLLLAREVIGGYERIYTSMLRDGYLSQKELAARRPAWYKPLQFDEISVAIARDGELQVCQGGHRLAMAKAAGVPRIPVWISAHHAEWSELRIEIARACSARDGRAPEPLLHPDLSAIPHRPEPVRALQGVHGMLPIPPATVLDLCPGWGYNARRLQDDGFDVTAVALDGADHEMLHRLRRAYGGTYGITDVRRADAEADASRTADVALALADLDTRLSSAAAAERLAALLSARRPRMMFLSGSPAAVAFCSQASQLSSVDPVPEAGPQVVRLT